MRPRPIQIVRMRAVFACGFVLLGVLGLYRLFFLVDASVVAKALGSLFFVVLIAYGALRIREYFVARRAGAAPP